MVVLLSVRPGLYANIKVQDSSETPIAGVEIHSRMLRRIMNIPSC